MRTSLLAWTTGLTIGIVGCATADGALDGAPPAQIGGDVGPIDRDTGADACGSGTERCNDADDDCDGVTDEGLVRACGEVVAGCARKRQRCDAGRWGACEGEVGGSVEVCDGLDDDCDGTADEGLSQACGSAVGACTPGSERCAAGRWVDCDAVAGGEEVCEGATDEDCDGTTDEGCDCVGGPRACGGDIGRCSPGEQRCTGGLWGACEGAVSPTAETCDGTDEDCDGTTDEAPGGAALMRACGSAVGACSEGRSECVAGDWTACVGSVGPTVEGCDGVDEDCDGQTDEGVVRACGVEAGLCRVGESRCVGGEWGVCDGGVEPDVERCDATERDEDCDGVVDEGCGDCVAGAVRACGGDIGACRPGEQACGEGAWGPCEGGVDAAVERCDGATDEDCDGNTDEGCSCVNGAERDCGSAVGACERGAERCVGGAWAACEGAVDPADEVCDGRADEDCDGRTDEGCDCSNGATRACGSGVGQCREGEEVCGAGRWLACAGAVGPAPESCGRGRDEDCDGTNDEGFRADRQFRVYADLRARHPGCEGNRMRWGDNCLSAIHRLCNDQGCFNSGFGPVENDGQDLQAVCVVASRGDQVTWPQMRALIPACLEGAPFSQHCMAAADLHCERAGARGGFGPVEYGPDGARVTCLDPANTERVRVTFAQLRAQHAPCDGVNQRHGPDCSAAAHRLCLSRGAESGVGPVQFPPGQPVSADILCVTP